MTHPVCACSNDLMAQPPLLYQEGIGRQLTDRVPQPLLPPAGDRCQVVFVIAVSGNPMRVLRVNHHVDRIVDIGRADARGIEGETTCIFLRWLEIKLNSDNV